MSPRVLRSVQYAPSILPTGVPWDIQRERPIMDGTSVPNRYDFLLRYTANTLKVPSGINSSLATSDDVDSSVISLMLSELFVARPCTEPSGLSVALQNQPSPNGRLLSTCQTVQVVLTARLEDRNAPQPQIEDRKRENERANDDRERTECSCRSRNAAGHQSQPPDCGGKQEKRRDMDQRASSFESDVVPSSVDERVRALPRPRLTRAEEVFQFVHLAPLCRRCIVPGVVKQVRQSRANVVPVAP